MKTRIIKIEYTVQYKYNGENQPWYTTPNQPYKNKKHALVHLRELKTGTGSNASYRIIKTTQEEIK